MQRKAQCGFTGQNIATPRSPQYTKNTIQSLTESMLSCYQKKERKKRSAWRLTCAHDRCKHWRSQCGHTARKAVMVSSCGDRLPLLSGSAIKWETQPAFSGSRSLSLLAKFTRVADFLKITCLRGLASLHIHEPLWRTSKMKREQKAERIPRSAVALWIQHRRDTVWPKSACFLVFSGHGQSVALCCLGAQLPGALYDLAFSHDSQEDKNNASFHVNTRQKMTLMSFFGDFLAW